MLCLSVLLLSESGIDHDFLIAEPGIVAQHIVTIPVPFHLFETMLSGDQIRQRKSSSAADFPTTSPSIQGF